MEHLALLYYVLSFTTGWVPIGIALLIYTQYRKEVIRLYALFLGGPALILASLTVYQYGRLTGLETNRYLLPGTGLVIMIVLYALLPDSTVLFVVPFVLLYGTIPQAPQSGLLALPAPEGVDGQVYQLRHLHQELRDEPGSGLSLHVPVRGAARTGQLGLQRPDRNHPAPLSGALVAWSHLIALSAPGSGVALTPPRGWDIPVTGQSPSDRPGLAGGCFAAECR